MAEDKSKSGGDGGRSDLSLREEDNRLQNALLRRIIQSSESVSSKSSAIAIAKSQGMLEQGDNGELKLTSKGRGAGRDALKSLQTKGKGNNGSNGGS